MLPYQHASEFCGLVKVCLYEYFNEFWSRGMFTIYVCSAPYWNIEEMFIPNLYFSTLLLFTKVSNINLYE